MRMTLDFDPSDEKDIDQLIETLKGLGVLKKVEDDRFRLVHTLPVHVLGNYNASPNIEYRYIDALEKAGIATIGQVYEHFCEKGSKKIKGIGEITEARIYAAINSLYSRIS